MTNLVADGVWKSHKRWSAVADRLKLSVFRWRITALALGISGASLETMASQLQSGVVRQVLAWLGAVCLVLIPLIAQRMRPVRRGRDWVRARSASEGLKSEAYKYNARCAPYEDPQAAPDVLRVSARKIEDDIADLSKHLALAADDVSTPPGPLTPEQYLEIRVGRQTTWYRQRARSSARRARLLGGIEMSLAIGAAMLGAAAGVWGDTIAVGGFALSIGAWVAVLTTAGGAFAAHIGASRYDSLVNNYLCTARRLDDFATQWPPRGGAGAPSPEWSAFVGECEIAISVENKAWMAGWTGVDDEPGRG